MAGRTIAFGGGTSETLAAPVASTTAASAAKKVKVLCVSNVEGRHAKLFSYVEKVSCQ